MEIQGEESQIDQDIIYDEEQVQYLSVGNKVADAFRAGMELKKSFDTNAEQSM